MLHRKILSAFFLISAIAITGCASTTHGPIKMDGRITTINELAARLTYKYNGGLKRVTRSQAKPRQIHFDDFSMTLFNVRARLDDVPDMVDTFRNYCWYRGGTQQAAGMYFKNRNYFSIACEPNDSRDPAAFIFFVNVVPVQNVLSSIGGYCVNFLASENRTDNVKFSDMANYARYRKRYESILKKTKSYC